MTSTVDVRARIADDLSLTWPLMLVIGLVVGALVSLRAAVQSALSALKLLRRMMVSSHLPPHHVRIAASRHHAEIAKTAHLAVLGTKYLAHSLVSHPNQPEAILAGGALLLGLGLFMLFMRGAIAASSPQDGNGAFGMITAGLGLFIFCGLVLVLHGAVAQPILTVSHEIVGSVISAA